MGASPSPYMAVGRVLDCLPTRNSVIDLALEIAHDWSVDWILCNCNEVIGQAPRPAKAIRQQMATRLIVDRAITPPTRRLNAPERIRAAVEHFLRN